MTYIEISSKLQKRSWEIQMLGNSRVRKLLVNALTAALLTLISGCGDESSDSTAPTVNSTIPSHGATNVLLETVITVTFSEVMDPASISANTFYLAQGNISVPGSVDYDSILVATFAPNDELVPNTIYTATVTAGAADPAGNALKSPYIWSFTTGDAPDEIAPRVIGTIPADAEGGVSTHVTITVYFSEDMDTTTITEATLRVFQGSTQLTGTVFAINAHASFTPIGDIAHGAMFTATISESVTDLAGNALTQDYEWRFYTNALADVTPPTVIATVPANLATGVDPEADISVTFSEELSAGSLTSQTFYLSDSMGTVAGSVAYSGTTAVFNPGSPLAINSIYTATVTTDVTDLAGNPIALNFTWIFTTSSSNLTSP